MTYEEVSKSLNAAAMQLSPADLPQFLAAHADAFSSRPFTDYMRMKFQEKDISQQNVFLAADLPERYGYKLISGEKRTLQRDVILRICLAAEFRLEEVQEALVLYGMAPLYARIPRDCAFIVAFNNRIYDIHDHSAGERSAAVSDSGPGVRFQLIPCPGAGIGIKIAQLPPLRGQRGDCFPAILKPSTTLKEDFP